MDESQLSLFYGLSFLCVALAFAFAAYLYLWVKKQKTENAKIQEVSLLINGLGATSVEELYILCNSVRKILDEKGIKVYRTFVGEYATSMEMAGASITICKMADEEMKAQIDLPVKTPFYTQA